MNRLEIREKFIRLSKDSIGLAWVLGPIYAPEGAAQLQEWGFDSYGEWIMEDICNPNDPTRCYVSRAHAYELARVGHTFKHLQPVIDDLAGRNLIGIRRLTELRVKVQLGVSMQDVEAHLRDGTPLPGDAENLSERDDQEMLIKIPIMIRRGDVHHFKAALALNAIAAGHTDTSKACVDLVLSSYAGLYNTNLGQFERFRHLIVEDRFYCKRCGKIPSEPTVHHVVPVGVGRGYGPQVLLCARPCHMDIVQPASRRYCEKWGWNWDQIIGEMSAQLREFGEIRENPYEVIE